MSIEKIGCKYKLLYKDDTAAYFPTNQIRCRARRATMLSGKYLKKEAKLVK